MRKHNATLSARSADGESAAASAKAAGFFTVDWSRNVMITVAVDGASANHSSGGGGGVTSSSHVVAATGLTNCSACTFDDMCKAADSPGDCHWCEMPTDHGGKSYCEVKGKLCRRGGGGGGDSGTSMLNDHEVDGRLVAAVRAAAASAGVSSEDDADVEPVLVSEVALPSQLLMRTYLLPNEAGLMVEEHAWWRHLPAAMKQAGLANARTYF
jgi:hypothetical protein